MPLDQRSVREQTVVLENFRRRIAGALGGEFKATSWMSDSDRLVWAVRLKNGAPNRDAIYVTDLFVEVKISECGQFPAPDLRAAEALFALVEKTLLNCFLANAEQTLLEYLTVRQRFVVSL